ncbi:ubiquinone/menaquinone biosynthesis C-methylase UbiE [Saccharothrix ecbatanensis]|uniref:Ubiquinone/menaquinone biosynthesis C-methylase UbiE n=1 Tax=Saccharothrix ecbatanensis TaxID=1105145 RepID=A0A7W9HLF9_9PSEU|nr:class I SAM-dependent methyltransferase [Saccharothrix ecbatanensis]MBB5804320.1 ubiquinone/menaquinone biosynthesis C-methylase UbiE [Saccharothrix ecbatanensis]
MPADPESSADVAVENDYDSFAEAYTVENDTSLINAYYTQPAIVDLAGDVAGRRILDAGCGSGPVSQALRERGAVVAGFDRSAKMVELARQRLGDDTDLRVADIGQPLPYPDGAFDDVVAALVLHYLEDWTSPLAELRRVLKPGGRLIVVVNHPIVLKMAHREADYFATAKWSDEYDFNGQKAVLTFWHRPLHAMTDAFTAAGFRTAVISEPPPAPEARELFPDEMARFPSGAFLGFLFFVLEAV